MAEEILPNLYRIEIPLPQNPLRAINSYVIKNGERALIIDTGMNRVECREAITAGLKELEIDLHRTDFLITHMHADHSGQAAVLATATSRIYASQADSERINRVDPRMWDKMIASASTNGFPNAEKAMQAHPGMKFGAERQINFSIIKDGDRLEAGDYRFTCIITPGHSPGHICLYEPDKKVLLSGDHILVDITPNISCFAPLSSNFWEANPLEQYLESLEKVYSLEVSLVLPGHRRLFRDFRGRIDELKRHHQTRANEVISILRSGGQQNAYQVAAQMTWDMDYAHWEDFPISQKWFATGEAVSHLRYLENRGKVHRDTAGALTAYSLT